MIGVCFGMFYNPSEQKIQQPRNLQEDVRNEKAKSEVKAHVFQWSLLSHLLHQFDLSEQSECWKLVPMLIPPPSLYNPQLTLAFLFPFPFLCPQATSFIPSWLEMS